MSTAITAAATCIGNYDYRTLDAANIRLCVSAKYERDVTSLWGRIKDYFLGTCKEDAKVTLFRLAHAETAADQFEAFRRLTDLIAPSRDDLLTWHVCETPSCAFQIGDFTLPAKQDWMSFAQFGDPGLNLEDKARLLLSMRYNGHHVATHFHEFGVGTVLDRTADSVLRAQSAFLANSPALCHALAVLGLHCNDEQGIFAEDLNQTVERVLDKTVNDGNATAQAGRNAENLSILMTHLMSPAAVAA
ncbi:hypothetical protein [Pandoraea norimbergensis]|uniref:Uncharacterized protein n=1 Tax=Pandoraea norimbergensis TaxID=93219 RepID=A0ABM5WK24_9BURK|nr:hypothetical protein [Pandoraea norimbergensis]ALS60819.1 hypothetical protein AT302_14670 [Pandoraea norimbergensis]